MKLCGMRSWKFRIWRTCMDGYGGIPVWLMQTKCCFLKETDRSGSCLNWTGSWPSPYESRYVSEICRWNTLTRTGRARRIENGRARHTFEDKQIESIDCSLYRTLDKVRLLWDISWSQVKSCTIPLLYWRSGIPYHCGIRFCGKAEYLHPKSEYSLK